MKTVKRYIKPMSPAALKRLKKLEAELTVRIIGKDGKEIR